MEHVQHFTCQLHLKHHILLELHVKLLKKHGLWTPLLKTHWCNETHETHANAVTAISCFF